MLRLERQKYYLIPFCLWSSNIIKLYFRRIL